MPFVILVSAEDTYDTVLSFSMIVLKSRWRSTKTINIITSLFIVAMQKFSFYIMVYYEKNFIILHMLLNCDKKK